MAWYLNIFVWVSLQPITCQNNIIFRCLFQPSMLQSPRQSWVLVLAAPYLHLLLLYHLLYAPVCIYTQAAVKQLTNYIEAYRANITYFIKHIWSNNSIRWNILHSNWKILPERSQNHERLLWLQSTVLGIYQSCTLLKNGQTNHNW